MKSPAFSAMFPNCSVQNPCDTRVSIVLQGHPAVRSCLGTQNIKTRSETNPVPTRLNKMMDFPFTWRIIPGTPFISHKNAMDGRGTTPGLGDLRSPTCLLATFTSPGSPCSKYGLVTRIFCEGLFFALQMITHIPDI